VRNSGGGSATAIVTLVVYWAIPTVGFSNPNFFSATTVAASPMRDPSVPGFVSASFSGVIPASAPDHICLLAVATHALDAAGTVADPVNDRHWAQHNLLAVTPKSYPFIQSFVVANPFPVERAFSLRVQQMDARSLEAFALRHRFEPGQGQVQILLLDGLGRPVANGVGNAQIQLTLGPLARQGYALRLAVQPPPAPHQVVVVEVLLYQAQAQPVGTLQIPVGALGIVINGSG
jgi:hypothetical protein